MTGPSGETAAAEAVDLWGAVVGQDAAVTRLRSWVDAPVHAYLLVGPPGSGTREAALAFAADLLAGGLDDPSEVERARRLVGAEVHPALSVLERSGAVLLIDDARDVIRRASLAPAEGERQVFVLTDFHTGILKVAPALLKCIEEPVPDTFFLVLAEEVTPELVTIASRCVRVDFDAVPQSVIARRLIDEGVDPAIAEVAATSAGGDLSRARLLSKDPTTADRHALWYSVPQRLDGTGSQACELVDEISEAIEALLMPMAEEHEAQSAELAAIEESTGGRRVGDRNRLEARQRREQRRVRTDELRSGLAAVVAAYRDALGQGGSAQDFLTAANLVQGVCDGLVFNARESLALQALFVSLPQLPSD